MAKIDLYDDLTILQCWHCAGSRYSGIHKCRACDGTGRVFWINGTAFPYTPAGAKLARTAG